MEQDAIETLLFMSSPENSGYRPSQQPQQTIPKSIAPSAPTRGATQNGQSHMNAAGLNGGYSTNFHNPSYGIESHAGDEIDRMLDQMEDSDSDDERPAGEGPPYRFDHLTTRGW